MTGGIPDVKYGDGLAKAAASPELIKDREIEGERLRESAFVHGEATLGVAPRSVSSVSKSLRLSNGGRFVSQSDVALAYDCDALAVEHFDLEIAEGELLAAVGLSGCGNYLDEACLRLGAVPHALVQISRA